jgi:hypothetical protein
MSEWSQGQMISLVALIGWLILVASGFASYRLGARQIVRMALVWAAIFVGGFGLVSWLM